MEFGYPGFRARNFRVWSSGARSLGSPVSEFRNMAIHKGNESKESSNKSQFGDPEYGSLEFWESGAQSSAFPISEFRNMVIHEGNEHRESSNKVGDWISSIPHLRVAGAGVRSLPSRSLTKWDMKEASQGGPRNRGPEFRSPAFGVFLPQISQHDT